jgi:hypothetical protein
LRKKQASSIDIESNYSQTMLSQVPICLFLIIFCLLHISKSIFIDITPGQSRCIGQELDEEDSAVFKLGAYSMGSSKDKKQELTATVR